MADKAPSKEDSRFLGARVEKAFEDKGVVVGKVIGHNPAVKEDQSDERWVVRYTTGKEEALSPQQLLEVLAPDADEPPAGGGSQSAAKGKRKTKGKSKADVLALLAQLRGKQDKKEEDCAGDEDDDVPVVVRNGRPRLEDPGAFPRPPPQAAAASLALSDTVMRSRRPQYPGADAWAKIKR